MTQELGEFSPFGIPNREKYEKEMRIFSERIEDNLRVFYEQVVGDLQYLGHAVLVDNKQIWAIPVIQYYETRQEFVRGIIKEGYTTAGIVRFVLADKPEK